jgi:hypothetical protein
VLVPLADALRVASARPGFSAELVPPEALEAISAIAAALPSAVDAFGFECRLAEGEARVDFGARITARSGGHGVLAGLLAGDGPGGLAEAPFWRRLAEFCADWADPESFLHWRIASLFLEFDVTSRSGEIPSPGVFLHLEPAICGAAKPDTAAPEGLEWLTDRALPLLIGAPLSPGARDGLVQAVEALPSGGRIVHMASMRSRGSDAIRVYASLPIGSVGTYLSSLSWPGDAGEIAGVCERYGAQPDGAIRSATAIQFEMGPALAPRIGVEFSSFHLSEQERREDWAWLLELLVRDGLCSKRKRDDLLSWPRTSQQKLTFASWPCTLVNELSHVKIAVQPGKPLEAKAYLTVEPRFSLFREERSAG